MIREKVKTKIIKWGNAHIFNCDICYEMVRRDYKDLSMDTEGEYWDDFFAGELKPIKFKLVKGWKARKKRKE